VQKGDTLWGICDTYFHDPWRWPKVWALNPDVTNPHWIFPGQTIRIGGITQSAPGSDPEAPATVTRLAPEARRPAPPPPPGNGALREVGFVDTEELAFAGTITGSREEKIMLASGDQAYVEFAKDKPLRLGQRYTIYQVDTGNPVKDPEAGKVLGYLVRIYGDRHAARHRATSGARLPGRPAVPPVQDHQAPPEHGVGLGARGRGGAAESADRRRNARGAEPGPPPGRRGRQPAARPASGGRLPSGHGNLGDQR
jgi:hypothetical protein